jgi:hypothetical protein
VIYAGDEYLAHSQQHPELYDDDGDPIDYPCAECGAEPGEECRPYCIGAPGAQRHDDEG